MKAYINDNFGYFIIDLLRPEVRANSFVNIVVFVQFITSEVTPEAT